MPATLPEDVWNQDVLDRHFYRVIATDHPAYPAIESMLRHCSTMASAFHVAQRLRKYLIYLHKVGIDPVDVTRDDLERWLLSMKHLAPATRQAQIAMVRNLCNELLDRELMAKDPTRRLNVGRHTKAQVRALTLAETNLILDAIRAELAVPKLRMKAARDYLLFALGFTAGPRESEMRRMTFGDFDLKAEPPVAHIFGKFQKHLRIALSSLVLEALPLFREEVETRLGREVKTEDAVFISISHRAPVPSDPDGLLTLKPLTSAGVYNIVRERLRDAGITGVRLGTHRLRKTAATLAYSVTRDVVTTSRMLGHSRPDQTWKHYIAPEEDLRQSASLQIPLYPAGLAVGNDGHGRGEATNE